MSKTMEMFTSKTAEAIKKMADEFADDEAKFEKGNKSAGVRARKTLMKLKKLCGERKKEMGAPAEKSKAA